MKDKTWLKEQLSYLQDGVGESFNDYSKGLNAAYNTLELLIDQLEEPNEIELSEPSAWKTIAKLYHPNEVYWGNVRDSYLESLDEPEKVVVPQFVGDWIELCKKRADLSDCLRGSFNYGQGDFKTEIITENEDWLFEYDHADLVARAWLDGYTVEKEKLYKIKLSEYDYLVQDEDGTVFTMDTNLHEYKTKFTEQEIKTIDERFWAFAEEVTK